MIILLNKWMLLLGFRVKLHVDGASDVYDFWVNADCKDIFPAGYCEKIGRKLVPPKAFAKKFTWAHYVKVTNSSLAPRSLFAHRQSSKNVCDNFLSGNVLLNNNLSILDNWP